MSITPVKPSTLPDYVPLIKQKALHSLVVSQHKASAPRP